MKVHMFNGLPEVYKPVIDKLSNSLLNYFMSKIQMELKAYRKRNGGENSEKKVLNVNSESKCELCGLASPFLASSLVDVQLAFESDQHELQLLFFLCRGCKSISLLPDLPEPNYS